MDKAIEVLREELKKIADYFQVTTDYLLGSSVDSKRTIRGEEVDTSDLTENQRLVLDWCNFPKRVACD